MKPSKVGLMAVLCLFASVVLYAQTDVSVEIRPRTEYAHGLKSLAQPGEDASLATSQRTRLNVSYKNDKFSIYSSLQDVRFWGNQSQLVGNEANSVSIHQAWAEVFFTPHVSLKAGRMELVYDNHRIFGNVGWAQQARSHDLALFKYEGGINAHLGIAYNQDGNLKSDFYTTKNSYKAMQFVWLNKKMDKMNASFLVLNNGVPYVVKMDEDDMMTEQGIRYSLTLGGNVQLKVLDNLELFGSAYSQTGSDVAGKDLSAYQFDVNATGKLTENVSLTLGFESLSGTSYKETSKNMSFSPLYGTNHKFNGFMDYFYVGNHGNNVGLNDAYAQGTIKIGNTVLGVHYHYFNAAAEVAAQAESYLGSEIDLSCTYNFTKGLSLSGGYSQMFASKSMEVLKGGDQNETSNWAWLMLSVNTSVLHFEK